MANPTMTGLEELRRYLRLLLHRQQAVDPVQAADDIVSYIKTEWGGQSVYIPSRSAAELSERDERIREQYDGKNAKDLAQQYGITPERVRQIVKKG